MTTEAPSCAPVPARTDTTEEVYIITLDAVRARVGLMEVGIGEGTSALLHGAKA